MDSNTNGTVAGHSVFAYFAVFVVSMKAAATPFVVAEESDLEIACLKVGSAEGAVGCVVGVDAKIHSMLGAATAEESFFS